MKTLEIQDDSAIILGMPEKIEKINYVFLDTVYSKAEFLYIDSNITEISLTFEGTNLDFPNLKELHLVGKLALHIFQNMQDDFLCAPMLEKVEFSDTEIEYLPAFIKRSKSIKTLIFRHGDLLGIPTEIFEMENLQNLSFNYLKKITNVPDSIKNLTKLVHFDLWEAKIDYLSPELFLLPQIEMINFYLTSYTQTTEVLNALAEFRKDGQRKFLDWEDHMNSSFKMGNKSYLDRSQLQ